MEQKVKTFQVSLVVYILGIYLLIMILFLNWNFDWISGKLEIWFLLKIKKQKRERKFIVRVAEV